MEDKKKELETGLLLEAIFQCYGHDFRNYSRASMDRRIRNFLIKSGCETISEIIPKVIHNQPFFELFLKECSITVTEMFRDPFFYKSIRHRVVPLLKTYPYLKIWNAGCATGEEAYSLAILLMEEELYSRSTMFATDFNDSALEQAKQGIYALDNIKQFTENYQKSGGTRSFSEYYHAKYESGVIKQSLGSRITFANHNLATDSVFGEQHLILCRNVLIYFNKELKNRVLNIFDESLVHNGFLCLGSKESLMFTDFYENYKVIDKEWKIYQKIAY